MNVPPGITPPANSEMRVNDHKQENLLSGFIDVKVPTKGRKIGPWKLTHFKPGMIVSMQELARNASAKMAWKRQWCAIQKSTDNCVELALGNNSKNINNTLIVPDFAILCRSESRTRPYAFGIFVTENKNHRAVVFLSGRSETESQQYMSHIRKLLHPHTITVSGEEFLVSLIDNSFSRSSGLYGIYGILNLNETEMVIRNSMNGEVTASWKWSQIERHYVRESTQNTDDSRKIFVFQIRCEHRTNYGGKLYLFCPQAKELNSAVSQYRLGRQHRLVTSPLPPTPPHPGFHSMRRLSRSEGDLRWPIDSSIALLHLRSRSSSRDRNSRTLMDGVTEIEKNSPGKIARSLILASASFSLLLSTPGCSDPDSLHEYQAIPYNHLDKNYEPDGGKSHYKFFHDINKSRSQTDIDHDNEIDDLGELFSHAYFRTTSAPCGNFGLRRVSGASVASGIYAEIDENLESTESEIRYQNLTDFGSECAFSEYSSEPPPLPPRRTNEHSNYRRANVSQNLSANEFSDNRINEQNQDQITTETQGGQYVDDYLPESQFVTINIKEIQDDKKQIGKSPPPLPPRRLCDIIVRTDQNTTSEPNLTDRKENMDLKKCDEENKHVPQISEPDYLPMSQVPMKMPINDNIYVVMSNIINNKMSTTVPESVP